MLLSLLAHSVHAGQSPAYLNFESGHVRPLALSSDGNTLYAVNTPDARLEVFSVKRDGLVHMHSVPVGLEPVAVALNGDDQAWVVNHLSDSVSVIDMASMRPQVVQTLLVGDEPRDIVFAGGQGKRAFITTAHRGQRRTDVALSDVPGAGDPQLTTAGVGRADVWVFDTRQIERTQVAGGRPLAIVTLFGDTPRALAVSPNGKAVYAAVFQSGNRTTVVSSLQVCEQTASGVCDGDGVTSPGGLVDGQLPAGPLSPTHDANGHPAPPSSLIVEQQGDQGVWLDELGRNWSNAVRFHLPDYDVFKINARSLQVKRRYSQVGTTLFNMAVNPTSGALYVSNTEANNATRFVGDGQFAGSSVQGHLAPARVTVIDRGSVTPHRLNPHIDYAVTPAAGGVKEHSLATPMGMAVSADGGTLYLAAFGSGKVGVFNTDTLERGDLDPEQASTQYLQVSGGGPSGLALDDHNQRLFVATRFDNGISMIDLQTGIELDHQTMPSPEPESITEGRRLFYDAAFTSSNGEASCSSCHMFGDTDHLAWDLGNPQGDIVDNPLPMNMKVVATTLGQAEPNINGSGVVTDLHPMKGPLVTQTLRGIAHSGAMHWRGDRAVGEFANDAFDERVSFMNFNEAFPALLGRSAPLDTEDMSALTDFGLSIVQPPNPIRALDNQLSQAQARGAAFFFGTRRAVGSPIDFLGGSPEGFTCEGCHTVDPAEGQFGTGGHAAFEFLHQIFKVPQLRNLHTKVGMFGVPNRPFFNARSNHHLGAQIRGYGFLHDGASDTIFRNFSILPFNGRNTVFGSTGFPNDQVRRDVEQFMFAFEGDLAPIVGSQLTVTAPASEAAIERLALLIERAQQPFVSRILGGEVTEADLVVLGTIDEQPRGWMMQGDAFTSDRRSEPDYSIDQLLDLAQHQALTFTAVPPGYGARIALDRDLDGIYNADDVCPAVFDSNQFDQDSDGVGDLCDNCEMYANGNQRDSNGDGIGNACDADLNNDGAVDFADFAIMVGVLFSAHDGDADLDGNGQVDLNDLARLQELWGAVSSG
ncbi:MAG: hypothetical protein DHS20C11_01710 [Lysobacteraceae bacterium]|nr:MAG: hypothetical protein DHS20C11_01710 [Xanthomonadaceae bacterium]